MNTEAGHAALCALDGLKGPARQQIHALLRALGLIVHVGQDLVRLLQAGQVDGDTLADQTAGHVVAHRACADDAYGLAQIGQVLFGAAVCQHIHGGIHLGQVSARQRQALALADAYGHQHGVVLLFQSRRIGDLAVYLSLDAAVQNVLDLLHHTFQRKAVRGDTAGHRTTQLGTLLKYGHIVTKFIQIVGRRQAARARTDDGDLFAGAFFVEALALPALLCVVLHREPLQAADADRIVDERPAAAGLAEMVADMAQHQREWDFFAYNGVSIPGTALADSADVGRDVDMCRALRAARHKGILPGLAVLAQCFRLVLQSAGGTDLHAGAAVTALVHQRLVVRCTDEDLLVFRAVVVDSLYTPDITADPHTAAALDAAVRVTDKQGMGQIFRCVVGEFAKSVASAYVLDQGLHGTVAVALAAAAVIGMIRQHQLHAEPAHTLDGFCVGVDHHPGFRRDGAGGNDAVASLDFHKTQITGAQRLQVRVVAQIGDVYPCVQRRIQQIDAFLRFHALSVYGQFKLAHDAPPWSFAQAFFWRLGGVRTHLVQA